MAWFTYPSSEPTRGAGLERPSGWLPRDDGRDAGWITTGGGHGGGPGTQGLGGRAARVGRW